MITLINSTKTNVVFVNTDVLVNSVPPPGLDTRIHKCGLRRVITNCVALLWVEVGQP